MRVLFIVTNNSIEITNLVSFALKNLEVSCETFALMLGGYISPSHISWTGNIEKFISCLKAEDYSKPDPVNILRDCGPDILILPNDTGISCLAFLEAAKFLEIPTLFIQPAIIIKSPSSPWQCLRGVSWLASVSNLKLAFKMYQLLWSSVRTTKGLRSGSFFVIKDMLAHLYRFFDEGEGGCTKIAVMGDYTKELFVERRISPQKIIVTGLPKLDLIYERDFNRTTFLKQIGLTPDKTIVSLLTDAAVEHRLWTKSQRRDFIVKIITAFKQLPEVQLIIKVHPFEDPTDYYIIAKQMKYEAKIFKEIDLYDVIETSDIIITGVSTAGLEALFFDKPLIVPNFYNDPEYIPYIRSGVAIGVYEADDIPEAINTILHDGQVKSRLDSSRKVYIYHHAYLQDGKASERVANLIIQMIEESKRRKE